MMRSQSRAWGIAMKGALKNALESAMKAPRLKTLAIIVLLLATAQAAGTLAVQLYRDAARQVPLDEQATISFRDHPLIPTRYTVSLFARVPARQDAGTGLYRLPLTVVIDY